MAIIFLGPKESAVYRFLGVGSEVVVRTTDPVTLAWLKEHDCEFVVSHGYRHVVRKDVIEAYSPAIINLHIGYLPWGGGADPNLWSFLEDVPAGVTIHVMDEKVDAGPILLQQRVEMGPDETLATSHNKLQAALCDLFCRNWKDLRSMRIPAKAQTGTGAFHMRKDKAPFLHLIEAKRWDTPVAEIRGLALARRAEKAKEAPVLLVRADAGAGIGTGHVMRCLALAQAWQAAGGVSVFALSRCPEGLRERLKSEAVEPFDIPSEQGSLEDLEATVALAKHRKASWVVADGYHLHPELPKAIRAAGLRVLVFDDYGHADRYDAHIVLNQNLSADASLYKNRSPDTQLLLGAQYASLRREFWGWREWKREIAPKVRNILVTMGGEDPDNVTLGVLQSLQSMNLEDAEVHVVVGSVNPHAASLQYVADSSGGRFRLLAVTDNMPQEMEWADVAVSAAGSTCWELAFMGLPSLLIVLAENQRAIATQLGKSGMALVLDPSKAEFRKSVADAVSNLLHDTGLRERLSRMGKGLVDGCGGDRVVAAMKLYAPEMQGSFTSIIQLRDVRPADKELLLQWRNLPGVAEFMYTDHEITPQEHEKWFRNISNDARRKYWIVNYGGNAIGIANLIDIDYANKRCSWAFYLADEEARGRGLGSFIEYQIISYVFDDLGLNKLCCEVFAFNKSVISLHERFGFQREGLYRQHIFKKGEPHDVVVLGLLKSEWNARKNDIVNRLSRVEKILQEAKSK